MTTITSVVKTYELVNGAMIHNGYFIVSNNYPLKWASKWRWESVKPSKLAVNVDSVLQSFENAQ